MEPRPRAREGSTPPAVSIKNKELHPDDRINN
jgi:hypothetical protein